MTQMPRADVEPGTVIETFQQGWMLHDRLVRPAMVIVSRAPDETGAQA
jgi:molecular chaperone GrpE